MALPSTAVWEVRPIVGSDTNGGGFDPAIMSAGTDYSQQNSANSSGNNISTTDVVATGVATITSATASFTAAVVGNIVYLSGSGITTGWYEVITYTNGTTVVLDRSPGTGTGVTMNIGGALATVATAYGTAALDNTIWIKATGDYTATATLTLVGNNQQSFSFIGYSSTRGDGGQATWTTATNSTVLIQPGSGNPSVFLFQNIYFTTSASSTVAAIDGGVASIGEQWRFVNCVFDGFTTAANAWFDSGQHYQISFLWFDSCEFKNCSGDGIDTGNNAYLVDCYFHGNAGIGLQAYHNFGTEVAGAVVMDRCVFYDNGAQGAYFEGGTLSSEDALIPIVTNCAFEANVGHGLDTSGIASGAGLSVRNNVFSNNGGYGWNPRTGQTGPKSVYANAYYNNSSGANSNSLFESSTDVTLTADPFNNPSGGDFTLNNTTGGGAACKGAGFPSSLP